MQKLCIVVSHPIQYYSPWFRHLAQQDELEVKVFYLWEFGVKEVRDEKFKTTFTWDIPLLDGYDSEFLDNQSSDPGTHHFKGLDNPELVPRLIAEKPDAILLFGYNYASHMQVIRAKALKSTHLLFRGDSHSLFPNSGLKVTVTRFIRSLIFRRFNTVLTVGSANEAYFLENGVRKEKLFRAPHCIDNTRFLTAAPEAVEAAKQWRRELGIPEDNFVFLFAGKFESKKRPLDLLRAFNTLEAPNISLLFVGSGELEDQLRTESTDRVFFAPFQNQSLMPRTYAMGNCLVLPSYGRGETWGLAVNEAMNLAIPAIVSSHVGCGPDLVLKDRTGWIFTAGDTGALAAAMQEACSAPDQAKEMGLAARDHVASFSYDTATKALLEAIQSRP